MLPTPREQHDEPEPAMDPPLVMTMMMALPPAAPPAAQVTPQHLQRSEYRV